MSEVVIILGPPGAGKGTQADILTKKLGAVHLSSGQMMRESGNQPLIDWIAEGKLAKTEVFLKIIEAAVNKLPSEQSIVFDGVGRMLPEAKWLNAWLPQNGRSVRRVIYLHVDHGEAEGRNLKRGRADDSPEAQKLRWQLYEAETLPVLDYWRGLQKLTEVDGVGTVEVVAARIDEVLGHAN